MDWKDRLEDIDDDYLIGLSNKGIVKRAYKDKEEVAAQIEEMGEEASVKVGGETVTVRFPLGESKCTCPSRSMCRHVVQAILVLRESCLKQNGGAGPDRKTGQEENEAAPSEGGNASCGEGGASQGGASQGTASEGGKAQETVPEGGEPQGTAPQDRSPQGTASEDGKASGAVPQGSEAQESVPQGKTVPQDDVRKETQEGNGSARGEALGREIAAYPLTALKKALGVRQQQNFVNLAAAGLKPKIRYSSVVTVELPAQEFSEKIVVKLLSPLEYSSCTCHKKELCAHKAAAILWCQLEAKVLTKDGLDMLGSAGGEGPGYDMARVRDAAGQMKTFLEELLATGLSRTSPDALDYLERLAIISHNAGLARFEGFFRALFDSYDRYFKRKAAFKTEDLMAQTARLYRRVNLLLAAGSDGDVLKLAGEFRADYLPAGNLDLIGISMESFQTPTGYEGETVYFLEETSKKWYTYTNARPMFYEPGRKRGNVEKSMAPWGLNLSLEELLKVRIHLTGAKCDSRRRLSSTQDTRGEVTGSRRLEPADVEGWYYSDFRKLYLEQIGRPKKWLMDQDEPAEGVNLVFVQPDSCAKAEFSQTGQMLSLPLYDRAGREMLIEVEYSKRESGTIKYLERIVEKKTPCFLGKIYLRDGRMRMYPVDVLERFSE